MPYGKPPSKLQMKAYRKAQKAVMDDPKKLEKVQVAFRKKHDYQGTKKTSVSKPKPKAKKVKIDFDDLYSGGQGKSGEYINDMAEETSFAKARAKVRKLLVVYNKTDSPTVAGAYAYIKEMKA